SQNENAAHNHQNEMLHDRNSFKRAARIELCAGQSRLQLRRFKSFRPAESAQTTQSSNAEKRNSTPAARRWPRRRFLRGEGETVDQRAERVAAKTEGDRARDRAIPAGRGRG